ncbi:MAG: rRNA pseudouridine synthase [Clostridiales bacterium]|nr:rRNA pseudouridine synthase [Clostridiales bacterium]
MRLQKYMASCGIASRRKCEEIIAEGIVFINGTVVSEPGHQVDPDKDIVMLNGKIIQQEQKYYFLFNKPENVLCTSGDSRERETVIEYFKNVDARLFTIGRLDYKTSGLIIVTNDGEFANHISHPRYNCTKEYQVKINNFLTDGDIIKLKSGMIIENHLTSHARVFLKSRTKNISVFNIIIHEGRNRQIRNMVEQLGYRVLKLERLKIGEITNIGLDRGSFRELSKNEIQTLLNI